MLGSPRSHRSSSWTFQDRSEDEVEVDSLRRQCAARTTSAKEHHFPDLSISLDFLRQQKHQQQQRLAAQSCAAQTQPPAPDNERRTHSLRAIDWANDPVEVNNSATPYEVQLDSTERDWRRSLAIDSHPIRRPRPSRSVSRDAAPGADYRPTSKREEDCGSDGSDGSNLADRGLNAAVSRSSARAWQSPLSSPIGTGGVEISSSSTRNPSSANDFSPFLESSSPSSFSSFSSRFVERSEPESHASPPSSSTSTSHPLTKQAPHRAITRQGLSGDSNRWPFSSSPSMGGELNQEGRRPPLANRSQTMNASASIAMAQHLHQSHFTPQSPASQHSASPSLPETAQHQANAVTATGVASSAAAATSPRVGLETMPEESFGLEDPSLGFSDNDSQFFPYAPPFSSGPLRPGRLRSTSSAAALQKYNVPQGTYDNWSRSASAWEGGTSPGTYAHAAQQHFEGRFPDRVTYEDEGEEDEGNFTGQHDQTAVQSPAERGRRPVLTANESALSASFDEDGASRIGSGNESRRHSIAASSAAGQHRAIGFEVNNYPSSTHTGMVSSYQAYQRPVGGAIPSRSGYGLFGGGSLAFSDEELANDLSSSLQLNLDKVALAAAERQQQQQQQQQQRQADQVQVRIPTSDAATTGAHAASMPPLLGERTLSQGSPARYSAIHPPPRRINYKSPESSSWDILSSPSSIKASDSPNRARAQTTSADFGQQQQHQQHFSTLFSSSPTMERHVSMSPQSKTFTMSGYTGQSESPSHFGTSPLSTASGYVPGLASRLASQQQQAQAQYNPQKHTYQYAHPAQQYINQQRQPLDQHQQQQSASILDGSLQQRRYPSASSPSLSSYASADSGVSAGGNSGGGAGVQASSQFGIPVSDHAIASLSSLGPIAPISLPHQEDSLSLQELGRGVPLQMLPRDTPLYIVEFKQGRTDLYFRQSSGGAPGRREEGVIVKGDLVIVEADRGKDLGTVVNDSITVDQVQSFLTHQAEYGKEPNGTNNSSAASPLSAPLSRLTRNINPKRLFSKATPAETSLLHSKAQDEERALALCTAKVAQRGLPMVIVAAEMQWDRRKLTFYYTASQRVDFRDLVKELFRFFKIRLYLNQLSSDHTAVQLPN